MGVRAKFYVSEHKQTKNFYNAAEGEILTTIKLNVVTGNSDENREFFRWSPAGTIDLSTVNPKVAAEMPIGREFYVDFTAVPPKE